MSSDVLSDDALREIETRPVIGTECGTPVVQVTEYERDSLCATVGALREKHSQLAEVSGEWARLLDRIRLWSKCADGYPLDEHINNITTQLAQATQERVRLTEQEVKVLTDYHYYEAEKSITRLGCREGQQSHLRRLKVIQDSVRQEQP